MRQPQQHGPTPLLHNPVAVGGLAAIAAVLVVIVAVVAFGSISSDDNSDTGAKIQPAAKTATIQHDNGIDGLSAKATSTLNVRAGPDNDYEVLGLLRRGAEVRVVGQSEDGEWLQIEYPVNSNLRGWVIVSSVEVSGDLAAAPVTTPEALPLPDIPTYEALPTESFDEAVTPEVTTTPSVTLTPAPALPDIVIGGTLVAGGILVVTVTNQGSGVLPSTTIDIAVLDAAGSATLNVTTTAIQALNPGASIDIRTGYLPFSGPREILVIADPTGKITESDDTNNRLTVSFSPEQTPTTPAATQTPNP